METNVIVRRSGIMDNGPAVNAVGMHGSNFVRQGSRGLTEDTLRAVGNVLAERDRIKSLIARADFIGETFKGAVSGADYFERDIIALRQDASYDNMDNVAFVNAMKADFISNETERHASNAPKPATVSKKDTESAVMRAAEAFRASEANSPGSVPYIVFYQTEVEALSAKMHNANILAQTYHAMKAERITPDADRFAGWVDIVVSRMSKPGGFVNLSNNEVKRRLRDTIRTMKSAGDMAGAAETLAAFIRENAARKANEAAHAMLTSLSVPVPATDTNNTDMLAKMSAPVVQSEAPAPSADTVPAKKPGRKMNPKGGINPPKAKRVSK